MHRRQPLPRLWLMTDERQGDRLWSAVAKLPRGSGIILRHYSLDTAERSELFRKLKAETQRRNIMLVVAGSATLAQALGAAGHHGRARRKSPHKLVRTAPTHNLREIRGAERAGAELLFLSPAFETRSHPGARALGPLRFMLLARHARVPVIALGGMNAWRAQRLGGTIYGWAGIEAWS